MVVNVQSLLDRHEKFKLKGMQLTLPELYDRLALQDDITTAVQQLKAENIENTAKLDTEKSLKLLELKNIIENGKPLTEKVIDARIRNLTNDKKIKLDTDKTVIELLQKRAENITQLTQIIKLSYKIDYTA